MSWRLELDVFTVLYLHQAENIGRTRFANWPIFASTSPIWPYLLEFIGSHMARAHSVHPMPNPLNF